MKQYNISEELTERERERALRGKEEKRNMVQKLLLYELKFRKQEHEIK